MEAKEFTSDATRLIIDRLLVSAPSHTEQLTLMTFAASALQEAANWPALVDTKGQQWASPAPQHIGNALEKIIAAIEACEAGNRSRYESENETAIKSLLDAAWTLRPDVLTTTPWPCMAVRENLLAAGEETSETVCANVSTHSA